MQKYKFFGYTPIIMAKKVFNNFPPALIFPFSPSFAPTSIIYLSTLPAFLTPLSLLALLALLALPTLLIFF